MVVGMVQAAELDEVMRSDQAVRLLIVEDDVDTLHFLATTFAHAYQVTKARTGEEALRLLTQHEYDLLLLDVGLPGMDGFGVLRAVRARFNRIDLPVMMLSAHDHLDVIVDGLNLGANDYVVKPPEVDILLARARTLVDLKRMNDTHKQMIHDLTQTQHMQDKFLSIVSHDLRNPLNNISTALFLLRDIHRNDPQTIQIIDQADSTLKDMLTMIKTFLDVSRLQPGAVSRLEISMGAVSLSDVIRNVIGQNRPIASEKSISLEAASVKEIVMGDRRLLSQAVGNLVDNAIKFSPRGSLVRVVVSQPDPAWVRITVMDQGPGVPQEERARLFEMFTKLSPRPTGSETSTGLGLWIVKQLVLLQGGRVGADFPLDGGSAFWIEMPVYIDEGFS